MNENTENENNTEESSILASNCYRVEPCLPEPSPADAEDYSEERKANDFDAVVTGSRGGLVNTPASLFTDFSEYKSG